MSLATIPVRPVRTGDLAVLPDGSTITVHDAEDATSPTVVAEWDDGHRAVVLRADARPLCDGVRCRSGADFGAEL